MESVVKEDKKITDDDVTQALKMFKLDKVIKRFPSHVHARDPIGEFLCELVAKFGPIDTLEKAGIKFEVLGDKLHIGLFADDKGVYHYEYLENLQDKLEDYGVINETWCHNMVDELTSAHYDRVDALSIFYGNAPSLVPDYRHLVELQNRYRKEANAVMKAHLHDLIVIAKRVHYAE